MPSNKRKRTKLRTTGESAEQGKISFAKYQGWYVIIKLFLILILAVDKTNSP